MILKINKYEFTIYVTTKNPFDIAAALTARLYTHLDVQAYRTIIVLPRLLAAANIICYIY
jgi:hypothetical protein